MHTIEPKAAFLVMRSNGWSLGKISEKLNIPRSTLFDWSGQMQQEVHYLKCFQVEKLQEKYIPSFEEELQQLSSYLARIERALQKQQFDDMRPEFLLHTALQLRSRLNELRSDVPVHGPVEQKGLRPLSVAGCISHSEEEIAPATHEQANIALEPNEKITLINGHHSSSNSTSPTSAASLHGSTNGKLEHPNRTNPDKNAPRFESDDSTSATCNRRTDALVLFTPLERAQPCPQASPVSSESQPATNAPSENRTNPDKIGVSEKLARSGEGTCEE